MSQRQERQTVGLPRDVCGNHAAWYIVTDSSAVGMLVFVEDFSPPHIICLIPFGKPLAVAIYFFYIIFFLGRCVSCGELLD